MPRRRYLDKAAPADATYNSVRPVYRNIQVKKKDTLQRRENEAAKARVREAQYRRERQGSIGPYRQKTAIDKAGDRLYAAAEQRVKDAQDREAAGVVLNALFKPIMPSTYADMYDAYKRGEVNNVTDALAAPYVTGSWSERNPGKALATDIVAPFALSKAGKLARAAGNDIANSWRDMRYSLAHPESQVYRIVSDNIKYNRGNSDWLPARSHPLVDLFRLQIPTYGNGSLGFGHKYRAIGRNKGLKDVIANGIRSKNKAYNDVDEVYWAQDAPLREYTKNSPLLLRYDKHGPANFRKGNFDNPTSSASNPINFYDENVTLHGRYPFYSGYHQIPKTEAGIRHAIMLNNLNRFVEQPVRIGVKGYLGYKLYDWLNR